MLNWVSFTVKGKLSMSTNSQISCRQVFRHTLLPQVPSGWHCKIFNSQNRKLQSDHWPLQTTVTLQNLELSKASIFQASITSKVWHCSKTINTYNKLLTLWIRALIIPALEAKAKTLTSPGDLQLIYYTPYTICLSINTHSVLQNVQYRIYIYFFVIIYSH